MIRAVIDTSALVAGIISPAGAPAALLRSWRGGEFDLILCPMLVIELRDTLRRQKFRRYISEEEIDRLIASITRAGVSVSDPSEIPSVCRDPNDDYLFALANLAIADVLVSVDNDVLEAPDPGLRVLTPGAFAEVLRTRWN